MIHRERHTTIDEGSSHFMARSLNEHIGNRRSGLTIMTTALKCMEPIRSIRQSCNTIVGMATDELNLERGGKVDGMKSLSHKHCT